MIHAARRSSRGASKLRIASASITWDQPRSMSEIAMDSPRNHVPYHGPCPHRTSPVRKPPAHGDDQPEKAKEGEKGCKKQRPRQRPGDGVGDNKQTNQRS